MNFVRSLKIKALLIDWDDVENQGDFEKTAEWAHKAANAMEHDTIDEEEKALFANIQKVIRMLAEY